MKIVSALLMVVFIFASLGGTKTETLRPQPPIQKRTTTQELIEKTNCFRITQRLDRSIDSFHVKVEELKNAEIHNIK